MKHRNVFKTSDCCRRGRDPPTAEYSGFLERESRRHEYDVHHNNTREKRPFDPSSSHAVAIMINASYRFFVFIFSFHVRAVQISRRNNGCVR